MRTADFSELSRYVDRDKEDPSKSRVAWSTSYNLHGEGIERAGSMMARTATLSRRAQAPAYHLIISFAPCEEQTRAELEHVSEVMLARVGM